MVLAHDGPGLGEIAGQAQLRGEHIHCPDRKNTQLDVAADDPIDDFVDRPIASSCYHRPESALDGPPCQLARLAGPGSPLHRGPRKIENLFPSAFRTLAASGGVENDEDFLHAGAVSYTHLRAHETPEHLVC